MYMLSDGTNDGFVLVYVKDGIIYPVALNQEEADLLDAGLSVSAPKKIRLITDHPIGEVRKIK